MAFGREEELKKNRVWNLQLSRNTKPLSSSLLLYLPLTFLFACCILRKKKQNVPLTYC